MKKGLGKTLVAALVLSGSVALAQDFKSSNEIESSCRIKAKEIAANTYRTCVVDQKNSQIEQIKKEYQAKLRALKVHYEAELKKMAGGRQSIDKKVLDETARGVEESTPEQESEKAVERPEAINSESGETSVTGSTEGVIAPPENRSTESSLSESTEKSAELPKAMPSKKITKQKSTVNKSPVAKKAGVSKKLNSAKVEKQGTKDKVSDMTIRLKQSPRGLIRDASGEMPEPIPVEMTQDSSI